MSHDRVRERVESTPAFGLLEQLRLERGLTSHSTRKIAGAILDNTALTVTETLTELAERARVSESSIVRFVRQQGYKRFQEFKVALAFDAAQEAAQLGGAPVDRQPEHFTAGLYAQTRTALEQTAVHLDTAQIRAIAQRLADADQVLVCGAGTSGVIALEYNYKLLRLGVRVTALRDPHMAAMQAALLGANSVCIVISRSGATIDALRTLKVARSRAATTIIVTSKPRSTGAHLADHVLLAAGAESPLAGGSLDSEISALFILNAVFAALLDLMPHARERLLRTAQAISDTHE